MKLFGHEFGGKKDATPEQTPATEAVATPEVAPTPEATVTPEVTATPETEPSIDDKVKEALGSAGTALSAEVADAEANGTLDVAPSAAVPASAEVTSAEINALPEVAEPTAETSSETSVDTFVTPAPVESQANETAPLVDQVTEPAPLSNQEFVPAATTTPEVTVDPVEDAADTEGSDDLWKEFNATAPVETTEAAASNPEQNQ